MKLHSPIATCLCFYSIRLAAILVLLMALAAPAKAKDIDGTKILSGNAVDGLKSTMVTPPATVLARIKSDGDAVRTARQRKAPLGDFWRGLDWPALGRISGIYGSQRILNGQPRQPHYGIDIAAPTGTPVYAPASGLVTLVKDLYFSGWTVVIAHGLGVNSSFLHFDRVDVETGMIIERGGLIGKIGATGRATGPHLDWRIDWQGRRIDPSLLVGAMPDPAT